ncbi:DUF3135 domain-containing protein [Propionivibrio sp.]|uniref:DUF3135 domain-containing protein n=1 Tax=Propionivibrio sp. TaxID=2212460 RepID=UPI00342590D6
MRKQLAAILPSHDVLSCLARDNPQSFEALRLELIESHINNLPETVRRRLRQLQFRIDGIRRRSRAPLGATIKIHALMWDSFHQMNDGLQDFLAQTPSLPLPSPETLNALNASSGHSAQIIQFQSRLTKVHPPGRS